jgi:hypothetical protein
MKVDLKEIIEKTLEEILIKNNIEKTEAKRIAKEQTIAFFKTQKWIFGVQTIIDGVLWKK